MKITFIKHSQIERVKEGSMNKLSTVVAISIRTVFYTLCTSNILTKAIDVPSTVISANSGYQFACLFETVGLQITLTLAKFLSNKVIKIMIIYVLETIKKLLLERCVISRKWE